MNTNCVRSDIYKIGDKVQFDKTPNKFGGMYLPEGLFEVVAVETVPIDKLYGTGHTQWVSIGKHGCRKSGTYSGLFFLPVK